MNWLISCIVFYDDVWRGSLTCSVSNLAITSNRTWQGVQKFTTGVQCMSSSFPAFHWHNSHRTNSSNSGYLGPCLVFIFGSYVPQNQSRNCSPDIDSLVEIWIESMQNRYASITNRLRRIYRKRVLLLPWIITLHLNPYNFARSFTIYSEYEDILGVGLVLSRVWVFILTSKNRRKDDFTLTL